ncbi:S1 RNA-binding domain-containing protein [Streptomyces sp. NBC_00124]|uniref:S1 RNA-binding domain-containing protein n=1 Tax=Streptomyces sp. NBC_00124 TaxID=2975662 RepID=UPI002254CA67|nr:S1 RNA-binding domain-containing protein [Streptomyces sp. NBC_00124]MCX5366675.1 S1 RNA-binding domain-containing protein [Streptomyces sp. NBC_00124]
MSGHANLVRGEWGGGVADVPASEARQAFLRTLEKGQVRKGTVSSVSDVDALVDLGGFDGLLRTPEVSWQRREVPLDQVLRVGQDVTVTVLDVDADRNWLTVSLKSLQDDPFREFARTHLGHVVPGKVTKVASIGVFVRIHDRVEGLLPASELPEQDGGDQSPAIGDVLVVEVADINLDRRRVKLLLRDAG